MDRQELAKFVQKYNDLSPRRREILQKVLAGETDTHIAESLGIHPGTVRKTIADICLVFGVADDKLPGQRYSKRADLVALFAKYKPELLGKPTPDTEEETLVEEAAEDRTSPSAMPKKGKVWQIVLETERIDKLQAIVEHLEKLGAGEIKIRRTYKGSWVLELESLPEVFERIEELYESGQLTEIFGNPVLDLRLRTDLSQWLQNVFEEGWQTVEALGLRTPEFAFRFNPNQPQAVVKRAKLVNLNTELADSYAVALVLTLMPREDRSMGILLQLYPAQQGNYLPPGLQLIVLESGVPFREAQARRADNGLQFEFNGSVGDEFTVKVALGDRSVTEYFVI